MPTMAMAEETICAAVYAALPALKTVWPNKAWDAAKQGPHPREGTDPWGALHIQHDGSDQHTMGEEGGRVFTRTGGVVLQLFVPAGQRGLEVASTLAMAATSAFEGKTIDGVRFYRVGPRTVGQKDGEAWYQVNVVADYEFDEVK